jgi:hypothetical protein
MKPTESQFPEVTETSAAAHWNGQRAGYWPHITVADLQKDADAGQPRPIGGAGLAEGKRDRALANKSIEHDIKKKTKINQGSGVIQSGKLVKGGSLELRQDLNSKKDGKK